MDNAMLEEKVLRKVMGNVPFGLVVTREGRNRRIYYMNSMAHRLLGYTREEYRDKIQEGWNTFIDFDLRTIVNENREQMKTGEPIEILAPAQAKNGEIRWLLFQIVIRLEDYPVSYVSYIDMTERVHAEHRQEREYQYVKERAMRDSLTRLLNRGTMEELIEAKLADRDSGIRRDSVGEFAYLAFDVDNFKQINDAYGHYVGDRVILLVADMLSEHFKEYDFVGRMGGDEFAVFASEVESREAVKRSAERFLVELHNKKEEMGLKEPPSVSIGIAFGANCGTNFLQLYNSADEALYRVKKQTKNGVAVFE